MFVEIKSSWLFLYVKTYFEFTLRYLILGDRPVSLVQSEGSLAYFGLRLWMFLFFTAILFMEGHMVPDL